MSHRHPRDPAADLRLAFLLNTGFAILEIVGGLWTNSVAILSDAVHDFGDSLALGAAWSLDRYSRKGRDRRFSYGYLRFSLLGAWINTLVLVLGSIIVLTESVPRLFQPEQPNATGMLLFALVGVAVNGAAAWRLRGRESLNTKVAAWHLVEDVLGWIAVLVVSITLMFVDLPVLDPMLSVAITAYILFSVVRHLRQTFLLFLQAVPEGIDLAELERRLGALKHVISTHHTQVWSMDGAHHVLTAHVVVDNQTNKEALTQLRADVAQLCEEYRFAHTTVEIEWGDDECRMGERLTGT
jgi:cobalt-zinc-cadmium efflux system protein